MSPIEEIPLPTGPEFEDRLRPQYRPFVMRGIAERWPLVEAGRNSPQTALDRIEAFDSGQPTDIMTAPPSEKGRFFYASDMRGFNFDRQSGTLSQLSRKLREFEAMEKPPGIYAGAAGVDTHLPGFDAAHPFPLVDRTTGATTRVWLGNATQVATHFDLSDNFAVVALGKRRFTLFPPDAVSDLYVGPLNVTLAGQPVSMVDPLAPDLDRYPGFERALERAQFAELEPGDVIYIPTLWWHHVAATAPINILVNYWHNDAPRGGGFLALVHAMLAIRDQPLPQREAWRAWFDHFVFGENAPHAAAHLPPHAQGINGPAGPQRNDHIRRFIVQMLSSN